MMKTISRGRSRPLARLACALIAAGLAMSFFAAPPARAQSMPNHAGHDIAGAGANTTIDVSAMAVRHGDLVIAAPWARATPAGARVGGGFLAITNHGAAPDRLVSARSDVADHVEIHEMKMEGEVMRMRPLAEGIDIKPGETLTLKPGSFHLMFMGLKQPLMKGERFKVRLTFAKAGAIVLDMKVRDLAAMGAGVPMNGEGHSPTR